jgi:hypothetical protein
MVTFALQVRRNIVPIDEPKEDEAARHDKIERHLESLNGKPSAWYASAYGIALDAVTKDATSSEDRRSKNIGYAIDYLNDLRLSLRIVADKEADTLAFWSRQPYLLYDIKHGRASAPDRDALEKSVGRYLDLPFRSTTIDRTLVDALVVTELVKYGSQVYESSEPRGRYASIMAVRPGRTLARNIVFELAFFAVLALGVQWLAGEGHYPAEWVPISLVGIALLLALCATATIIRYPRYVRDVSAAHDQVLAPLRAMIDIYDAIDSAGPVSLDRVRASVNEAALAKVRWPPSLYALLDDIAGRSRRI